MSSDARPTRSWAAVLVLWVLLTAVGVVLAVVLPGHVLPRSASSTGTDVRRSLVLFGVLAAPLVALFATVLAFNQLGEGLRRALDPVLRR